MTGDEKKGKRSFAYSYWERRGTSIFSRSHHYKAERKGKDIKYDT